MELAEVVGLQKIKVTGSQLRALCPLHDDHDPSFSLNTRTGDWYCHAGCGGGHLPSLLRRLGRDDLLGRPTAWPERERKTTRTPGSKGSILEMMRWAFWMQSEGYREADVTDDLQSRFEVSRSTAYEVTAWVYKHRLIYLDARGRARGRRYAWALKQVLYSTPEYRRAVEAQTAKGKARFQQVKSYMKFPYLARVYLDHEKYGQSGLTRTPEVMEAMLHLPNPPPEIGQWSRVETGILLQDLADYHRLNSVREATAA